MITRRARMGYFWPLVELFKDTLVENARVAKRWVEDVVRDAGRKKKREKRGAVPRGERLRRASRRGRRSWSI
jgi:hypothetical protein